MNISNIRICVFCTFLLFNLPVSAQSGNPVLLTEILRQLEDHFEISFSYVNEHVDNVLIKPLPETAGLSAYLDYISRETHLEFDQLSERYYAISQPSAKDVVLCGYLVDRNTGEPLDGATVLCGETRTIAGNDGYFRLQSPAFEDSLVIILHIAYEETGVLIDDLTRSECPTIRISSRVATLEEVVVSNYVTAGIEKRSGGEFTIHSSQLKSLPGLLDTDVMMGIQALPGVYSAGESVSDINIRGGTNEQNLILWDGVRMYQSGHFFGLISVFNPYFSQQLTLIKNGTPARYGRGVSGTIDIRSAEEVAEQFSAGGGFNLLNADVGVITPLQKGMSLQLAARHSVGGLLQTPTYNQYYSRAFGALEATNYGRNDTLAKKVHTFDYADFNAKFLYDVSPKDKLRVSFIKISDQLNYRESATVGTGGLTRLSELDQHSNAGGVTYIKSWSPTLQTEAGGYLSHYRLTAENDNIVATQELFQENEVLDWGLRFDTKMVLHSGLQFTGGYHFSESGISNRDEINNPSFRRLIKEVLHTHVAYAEGNYLTQDRKFQLRTGLRANYYQEIKKLIPEPRLVSGYQINRHWSVELAGEMKSQTAVQIIDLQNDFLGVEKRRWVLANNLDIPIVTSRQISIGMQFDDGKMLLSLEGYRKDVDGIITSSQAFQNQFELIRSAGSYNATGLDMLLNYRKEGFSTWLSYNLSSTLNKFEALLDDEFPGNVDIRHFIGQGISYSSNQVECSLGFNWHTGRPYTRPVAGEPVIDGRINYAFPNGENLGGYFRVDCSARYHFKIGKRVKAQVGLSLWNLMDRDNPITRFYRLDSEDNIVEIDQYGLGFTPNAMCRLVY